MYITNTTSEPKIIEFQIDNFIDEHKFEIISYLRKGKKSLLVAPLGVGKTRLLPEINDDKNLVTVIVIPSVMQLRQIKNTYNIKSIYAETNYNFEDIVCVTPESLKKKLLIS